MTINYLFTTFHSHRRPALITDDIINDSKQEVGGKIAHTKDGTINFKLGSFKLLVEFLFVVLNSFFLLHYHYQDHCHILTELELFFTGILDQGLIFVGVPVLPAAYRFNPSVIL